MTETNTAAQGAQNAQQTNPAETRQNNATPAATGGKTFTQDEVNQIVADRLARERSKAEPKADPLAAREQQLADRENDLKCRELVNSNTHYPSQLLDLIDTHDFDTFKNSADKWLEAFPGIAGDSPTGVTVCTGGDLSNPPSEDPIGAAFRRH